MPKQPKAAVLVSGGLDSMLAVAVLQQQGVHVEGLNFFTGFCVEGHTQAIRHREGDKPQRNNALWVAEQLGIKLHFIDVVEAYRDVVLNPTHGYGANLNPCLDCKIFMVAKAREWSSTHGFDFIATGEVIGQRPMSQRRDTMPVVQRDSGADDLLLRPLSAKLLPETLAEREGWVQRDGLYGFSGRSRKPQMQLAAEFGINEYAQPAGGCCFLTDPQYSVKLKDLWASRHERAYELDDIMLLKVGRHFRPAPHYKLIVAREEGEGNFLRGYRRGYTSLRTLSHAGPEALIDGAAEEQDLMTAARIIARYSKGRQTARVRVELESPDGTKRELDVQPFSPAEIPQGWLL